VNEISSVNLSKMASSSASRYPNPSPILPSSGFSTNGWVAINRPRTPSAGPKSPDQTRVQRQPKTTTTHMGQNQLSFDPHIVAAPQQPSDNLTASEREQWENEFDRVLQGCVDIEDDLPDLLDLPELARNASGTPLRSSTCPPTPQSHARQCLGPSKCGGRPHTVIIMESEDEDGEDMIAGMKGKEHQRPQLALLIIL